MSTYPSLGRRHGELLDVERQSVRSLNAESGGDLHRRGPRLARGQVDAFRYSIAPRLDANGSRFVEVDLDRLGIAALSDPQIDQWQRKRLSPIDPSPFLSSLSLEFETKRVSEDALADVREEKAWRMAKLHTTRFNLQPHA
jgi:hypothetical protein